VVVVKNIIVKKDEKIVTKPIPKMFRINKFDRSVVVKEKPEMVDKDIQTDASFL
jgi:hypothetical protein